MSNELTQLQILRNLNSTDCLGCNGTKLPKQSFCRKCYFSLPKPKQTKLYKGFFDGYVSAFKSALSHITETASNLS